MTPYSPEIAALYPEFASLSAGMRALLDDCERKALARAACCCFPSDWAADGAARRYGVPPDKIRMIPFGPNTDGDDRFVARKRAPGEALQILFLRARRMGAQGGPHRGRRGPRAPRARRTVSPDDPRNEGPRCPRVPYIETIGYLDKNDPAESRELRAIFDRSHLLLLASAADASPMVLSEAACHGLPAVTRAVGGIPTLVVHGVTGLVLPRDADARAFALAIRDLANEEGAIERMSRAARVRFENTLNWTSWAKGIVAALETSGHHDVGAEARGKLVSTESISLSSKRHVATCATNLRNEPSRCTFPARMAKRCHGMKERDIFLAGFC